MHKVFCFEPQGYFGSNTYLIECDGEFAIVDPSVEYLSVLREHPEIKGRVKYILLTHAHFDHILKINTWTCENAGVYVGNLDSAALSDPYLNCYLGFFGIEDGYSGDTFKVSTGDTLKLGNETVTVIECPGHTPGGVGYLIENSLFIGDTLFANGGYGRCDLPGGDMHALADTIGKLFASPIDYTLYCGHGESTTLFETKKYFS